MTEEPLTDKDIEHIVKVDKDIKRGFLPKNEIDAAKFIEDWYGEKLATPENAKRLLDKLGIDVTIKKNKTTQKKNEITEQILEVLGNRYVFKTPTDTEELHLYKDGVYIEARATIKSEIESILKHSATIGFCNEIIDHFRRRSYVDREEFNNIIDYLPLTNGLLNLKTLKLEPHSPDNIFTFKIPTTYNPDAKCPRFLKAFNEIITDNDDRLLLQEYAGYSLLSSFPHHQLLFLIGKGRNGKGVYIRTIEGILGKNNVSNVRLEEFNGGRRFVLARLYGKLMNICSEPRTRFELETELLKMVTGDDSIDAELKNIQKPLKFTSFAKFFVQANRLPRVADNTDSFWERVLIVKFSQKFTDALGNRIANVEKTWLGDEEERSGVLNWMLAGLKRLMDNQRFTVSKSMKEQKTLFKQLSDTIGAFLEDESAVRYGPTLFVKTEDLYNAYKAYVENIGGVVESIRALNAQVRMTPNILEGGKREGKKVVRIWKGIDIIIKNETDEDQQLLDKDIEEHQTNVEQQKEEKQEETPNPVSSDHYYTKTDKMLLDWPDDGCGLYKPKDTDTLLDLMEKELVEEAKAGGPYRATEKGVARIKELKEKSQ
jgi:P4 family phage/plasmid primase-like protien